MRLPETETGEFIPGNPATGKPGSMLTAAYMNSDLREKKGILAAAGIAPNPQDDGQIIKAINWLINKALQDRGIGTVNVAPDMVDLDDPTVPSGMYYVGSASNGLKGRGFVLHKVYGGAGFQLGQVYGTGKLQFRDRFSGSWRSGFITLANEDQVIAAAPAGAVQYFAMQAPPVGWLRANGAAVSVTAYAALATSIYVGDTLNATAPFGYRCTDAANPATTRSTSGGFIVLPDMRGVFPRGWSDGRNVDAGRAFGSEQMDAVQNITGYFELRKLSTGDSIFGTNGGQGAMSWSASGSGSSNRLVVSPGGGALSDDSLSFDASRVARTAAETRPRNVALLSCIKF